MAGSGEEFAGVRAVYRRLHRDETLILAVGKTIFLECFPEDARLVGFSGKGLCCEGFCGSREPWTRGSVVLVGGGLLLSSERQAELDMKNGLRETLADVSIPLVKIPAHPVRLVSRLQSHQQYLIQIH